MATLPTIVAATPLDADDGNYLVFSTGSTEELTREIGNTPEDFASMDTLTFTVVERDKSAAGDDTYTLEIRIMTADGTRVLAANSGSGDRQLVVSHPANARHTSDVSRNGTFNFVGTTRTKEDWDGAHVDLRQVYSQNMANDQNGFDVDYVEFNGTYTSAGATFTGSGASTLAGATSAGSGTQTISGTGASTLADVTSDGSGTVVSPISGSGASTLDDVTSAGAGAQTISGAGASTLADVTSEGSGTSVLTITGTGASTLDGATSAGSGTQTISGTGASTLAGATSAGAGTQALSGTGALTLDDVTSAGSGTTSETFTGTGASTLAGATSSGTGTQAISGTGASTLADVTSEGSGTAVETFTGTGASTLAGATSAGTGTQALSGTGASTLANVTSAGTGTGGATGEAPQIRLLSTNIEPSTGSITVNTGDLADGETAIALILGDDSSGTTPASLASIQPPDGTWTEREAWDNLDQFWPGKIFTKPISGTPPASYTFDRDGQFGLGALFAVSGDHTFDGSDVGSSAGSTSVTAPAVTITADGVALRIWLLRPNGTTGRSLTEPAGLEAVLINDLNDADFTIHSAGWDLTTATSTGTSVATASHTEPWYAQTVAFTDDSGGVATVTGTGASTLAGVTSAGSGTVADPVTGTGASTLDDATSAGAGTQTISGTGASTLAGASSTGVGTQAISGTGASTLDDVTSAGAGTASDERTGTGASTLDDVTSSGAGTQTISGTGASTLDDVTSEGTGGGGEPVVGSGASTLEGVTSAGSGAQELSGAGASTLDDVTCAGAGIVANPVTGTGASVLAGVISVGVGGLGRWHFTPPTRAGHDMTHDPEWTPFHPRVLGFFGRLGGAPAGVNVWRDASGAWHEGTLSNEDMTTAQAVYLGGRTHNVGFEEAEALEAAGYEVTPI